MRWWRSTASITGEGGGRCGAGAEKAARSKGIFATPPSRGNRFYRMAAHGQVAAVIEERHCSSPTSFELRRKIQIVNRLGQVLRTSRRDSTNAVDHHFRNGLKAGTPPSLTCFRMPRSSAASGRRRWTAHLWREVLRVFGEDGLKITGERHVLAEQRSDAHYATARACRCRDLTHRTSSCRLY